VVVEQADEVRPGHVEQVDRLLGGQLGVDRQHGHGFALRQFPHYTDDHLANWRYTARGPTSLDGRAVRFDTEGPTATFASKGDSHSGGKPPATP
jgi:hypothetical protein